MKFPLTFLAMPCIIGCSTDNGNAGPELSSRPTRDNRNGKNAMGESAASGSISTPSLQAISQPHGRCSFGNSIK